MTHIVIPSSEDFLMQLASPALRAIMLAGVAGLALALFSVKATSIRLLVWKSVLCGALAMPLLAWVLPALTIPTPAEFSFAVRQVAPQSRDPQPPLSSASTASTKSAVASGESAPKALRDDPHATAGPSVVYGPGVRQIQWPFMAAAVYFSLAGLLLLRLSIGLFLGRRLLRHAKEIQQPRLTTTLARRARWFGLTSVPRCAESELISVPITMGVLRPAVLLPTDWAEWDDAKIEAVVAHEMSHVARRDALTQHLSLLHRAVFWFSPLAWWLDRHLAELAEQASDEAALACGADSNDYAKALVGFFETLHTARQRVWWQGVAMAKVGHAERRLERILAWNKKQGAIAMGLKRSAAAAVLVFALPTIFLAASLRPVHDQVAQRTQDSQVPPAPAKPSAAPPASPAPTAPPSEGTMVAPPVAPTAPPSPGAAIAALATAQRLAREVVAQERHSGYSYAYGNDDDDRFAIVSGKADSMTMSGSWQDVHHLERLRKQISGDFLWFQRDEKSYIIRDQDMIDRARKVWAPQEELGRKQEELGKQQEALGKQQEALGEKMEQVKVNVPDMTAALDKLKAKLKALGPTASQDQLGEIQSEIGELQSRIGEVQSHAGEQQSKVGEEMSTLGEQQSKLGEQQDALGRQQEEAVWKAIGKMKELFDEAIKSGKAQPEPQSGGGTI